VGKSSLISKLLEEFPEVFGFSVSHTTRQPREGEENGVDYHFVSKEEFSAMVNAGEFVEHAEVHGNCYGTSRGSVKYVLEAGAICLLDVDVQGARSIRGSDLDPYTIFIMPPSLDELERRLKGRGDTADEQIAKRVANASAEIQAAGEPGLFDVVIVNDDFDQAHHDLVDSLREEVESFFAPSAAANQMAQQPFDPTEGMSTAELLAGPKRPPLKLKFQVKREHPLYTTSAQVYGAKQADGMPVPGKFFGVCQHFSKGYISTEGTYWPKDPTGLETATHHSKVHRSEDFTTAYYQPGLKYGGAE
jgi:guanylate kinase